MMRTKILCLLFTLTILLPTSSVIGLVGADDSPYNHLVEIVPMQNGYIRSNGTVEPASLPIERTGNYYILKDDIVNYTIEIQSNNIIFDGNGHTLSLPQESYTTMQSKYGPALIQIINSRNIVLQNTTFSTYYQGVRATNSSRITIFGNNFASGHDSITLLSCSDCDVVGNNLTENSVVGLGALYSTYLNIAYNNISRNQNGGCLLQWVTYSNITRNNIVDNSLWYNSGNGIYVIMSANNRFIENNFINNPNAIIFSGNYNSSVNNLIYNNYFRDNHVDILNIGEDVAGVNESPLESPANISYQPQLYTAPPENPTNPDASNNPDLQTIAIISSSAIIVTLLVAGLWQYRRKHTRKQ
jgi:hypothetical protein